MTHSPATFACPHCRAPLRMRERPTPGLSFSCPDCHHPLELAEGDGEPVFRKTKPAGSHTKPHAKSAQPAAARTSSVAAHRDALRNWGRTRAVAIGQRLRDPLIVTWLAAGVAAIALGVAFLREHRSDAVPSEQKDRSSAAISDAGQAEAADLPGKETGPTNVVLPDRLPVEAPRELVTVPLPEPVTAPRPEVAPPVDRRETIRQAFAQKIVQFEQATPVPLETLLLQLEEMAGVPIEIAVPATGESEPRDGKEITVSLRDATLGDVLERAAAQAGLEAVIEEEGVRLVPAGEERQASRETGDVSTGD